MLARNKTSMTLRVGKFLFKKKNKNSAHCRNRRKLSFHTNKIVKNGPEINVCVLPKLVTAGLKSLPVLEVASTFSYNTSWLLHTEYPIGCTTPSIGVQFIQASWQVWRFTQALLTISVTCKRNEADRRNTIPHMDVGVDRQTGYGKRNVRWTDVRVIV